MKNNDALKSALLAFMLIALCHLLIRFGSMTLSGYGALGFMPGSYIENVSSRNPLHGLGGWRSYLVINGASWLAYFVTIYAFIKLWRRIG
jgi:hypothetical protein